MHQPLCWGCTSGNINCWMKLVSLLPTEFLIPSATLCCYKVVTKLCHLPFCRECVHSRMSVFGGTAQQCITTSIYILCHIHFNEELKLACDGERGAPYNPVGEYVDLLKKLRLPVVAICVVGSILEDRVEETKSTIVPLVLSPGCHDYSSILENTDFNVIALMKSATVVVEGQIPAVMMVNMTTTSRVGKANSCF